MTLSRELIRLSAVLLLASGARLMLLNGAGAAVLGAVLRGTKTRRGFMAGICLTAAALGFAPELGASAGAFYRSAGERLGVSPEKMAFLANASSALSSCTLYFAVWSAAALPYVRLGLDAAGGTGIPEGDFLKTAIPFLYFPLSLLVVLVMSAAKLQDMGALLKAERKARQSFDAEALKREAAAFQSGYLPFVLPGTGMLVVAAMVLATWRDPVWAALAGSGALFLCSAVLLQRRKREIWREMRKILLPVGMVLLAILVSTLLSRADLSKLAAPIAGAVPTWALPMVILSVSLLASLISGSGMAALSVTLPLAIPAGWFAMREAIYYTMCTAAALSGAIAGTMLAPHAPAFVCGATFSGCRTTAHLCTQGEYVLFCVLCACVFGYLPVALGFTTPFGLLVTAAGTYAVYDILSKSPDVRTRRYSQPA